MIYERTCLQVAVSIIAFVPVSAGLAGVLFGLGVFENAPPLGQELGSQGASPDIASPDIVSPNIESHGRYLSGLLFAIGLGFLSTVPDIARQGPRFRLLTALVVVGGLARLGGLAAAPWPSVGMIFGLTMELLVTPALALWRERIEAMSRVR